MSHVRRKKRDPPIATRRWKRQSTERIISKWRDEDAKLNLDKGPNDGAASFEVSQSMLDRRHAQCGGMKAGGGASEEIGRRESMVQRHRG
jgi:hypothetical protein